MVFPYSIPDVLQTMEIKYSDCTPTKKLILWHVVLDFLLEEHTLLNHWKHNQRQIIPNAQCCLILQNLLNLGDIT